MGVERLDQSRRTPTPNRLRGAFILTLVLGAASERLQLDVRWSTLLPESMPEVMEFKKIDANFYQPGNMIIAIRGPDPIKLEALTDAVTALLENELVCEQSKTVDECKAEELYAAISTASCRMNGWPIMRFALPSRKTPDD